jgi:hypothetical protein
MPPPSLLSPPSPSPPPGRKGTSGQSGQFRGGGAYLKGRKEGRKEEMKEGYQGRKDTKEGRIPRKGERISRNEKRK